jgi:hypothetical protein
LHNILVSIREQDPNKNRRDKKEPDKDENKEVLVLVQHNRVGYRIIARETIRAIAKRDEIIIVIWADYQLRGR